MTIYSISELWRYPVKSMGGERVEGLELRIGDATPRCVMTTLAQSGYEQAKGVLQVLAATARKEFGFGAFACFGTNAEVTAAGSISVGEMLTVPD